MKPRLSLKNSIFKLILLVVLLGGSLVYTSHTDSCPGFGVFETDMAAIPSAAATGSFCCIEIWYVQLGPNIGDWRCYSYGAQSCPCCIIA